MESPKERIRANIYKSLLEEEKKKGKKKMMVSLSVFVVGVITGSSYNFLSNIINEKESVVVAQVDRGEMVNYSQKNQLVDELFQENGVKLNEKEYVNNEDLFTAEL